MKKKQCSRCKLFVEDTTTHFIDENYVFDKIISNTEELCLVCHLAEHAYYHRRPFITVTKVFKFDSAHYLPNYEGKCSNLHGHQWRLEVSIRKRINENTGMVVDFGDIKTIVNKFVIDILDHSTINDRIKNPTAENMLIWIWNKLSYDANIKGLEKLVLWETDDSFATITKDDIKTKVIFQVEPELLKLKAKIGAVDLDK